MSTQFTSADCLARVRRYLPNPTNTDFPADADVYAMLTEAENEVKRDLLGPCPWMVLQPPTLMSTTDGGLTWTFGTDSDGNAIVPFGASAIYRRKEDVPDFPMERSVDYLDETVRIRMPSNRADPISFPDGAPYFYGNIPTILINASAQPTLQPLDARILMIWKASANALIALGADEGDYERRYDQLILKFVSSFQLAAQNAGAMLASRSTLPTRMRRLFTPYSSGRGW